MGERDNTNVAVMSVSPSLSHWLINEDANIVAGSVDRVIRSGM